MSHLADASEEPALPAGALAERSLKTAVPDHAGSDSMKGARPSGQCRRLQGGSPDTEVVVTRWSIRTLKHTFFGVG